MVNKTWGGRFSETLDSEVASFHASIGFDHVLYAEDISGSIAHVGMLARQELLTRVEAAKLMLGLREIKRELAAGQHPFDVAFEDIHMFIEHLLTQKCGNLGKKLHTGRSRNDQVALDLRLYTRKACSQVLKSIDTLNEVLQELVIKHANDLMPGYTHLQQAQPIQLGAFFGAYQAMLVRDRERFLDVRKRLNYSPLGAGSLAGSQLPLDRYRVAKTLKFDGIIENTLDAVSDRDFVIEFCSSASILMMHLSRLAEDLIVFSTQEFGFIKLHDAFATGSSLMPNKKNPDVMELIRGKSGRIFGHLMGILTMMKGLPLAYNKDMQEDKEGLFDTVKTVLSCLSILPRFLKSLSWNLNHMHEVASQDVLQATAKVEKLVLKGVPFREAHHQVGEWVKCNT